jgi:hypothetical protein
VIPYLVFCRDCFVAWKGLFLVGIAFAAAEEGGIVEVDWRLNFGEIKRAWMY